MQAAIEQNHQEETLNINQNKKGDWRRNNNLLMIKNKLILCIKGNQRLLDLLTKLKKNKRCEDEERNLFWRFGIWNTRNGENLMRNKGSNFVFAKPINWDNFSDEDKTNQEVRYHKGHMINTI